MFHFYNPWKCRGVQNGCTGNKLVNCGMERTFRFPEKSMKENCDNKHTKWVFSMQENGHGNFLSSTILKGDFHLAKFRRTNRFSCSKKNKRAEFCSYWSPQKYNSLSEQLLCTFKFTLLHFIHCCSSSLLIKNYVQAVYFWRNLWFVLG